MSQPAAFDINRHVPFNIPIQYITPGQMQVTEWENPLDRPYVLDLHVRNDPTPGKPPPNPSGKVRVTIPAKGKIELPSDFDVAIHTCVCHTCSDRKMYCRDLTHDLEIIGGLGPHLKRRGSSERLAPALNEAMAREKAALQEAMEARRQAQLVDERYQEAVRQLAAERAEHANQAVANLAEAQAKAQQQAPQPPTKAK
jgi:hypothetical protein